LIGNVVAETTCNELSWTSNPTVLDRHMLQHVYVSVCVYWAGVQAWLD